MVPEDSWGHPKAFPMLPSPTLRHEEDENPREGPTHAVVEELGDNTNPQTHNLSSAGLPLP